MNPNFPNGGFNPNQQFSNAGGGFPATGGFQPQGSQQNAPSLTSPEFLNMALDYDPQADANAKLPPITPSEIMFGNLTTGYQVTATIDKWETATSQQGQPYAKATMVLTIVNNQAMNGRMLRFYVSTLVSQNMKTSSAQQIIQAAGLGPQLATQPKTVGTLMNMVNHICQNKIVFSGVVDWEARFWDSTVPNPQTGKLGMEIAPSVRGYRNFPLDSKGMPLPEITRMVTVNGVPRQETRTAIMTFHPLTPANNGSNAGTPQFAQTHTQPQFAQVQQPQQFAQQPQMQTQPQPQFQPPVQQQFQPPAQTAATPQQQQFGGNGAMDIFNNPAS